MMIQRGGSKRGGRGTNGGHKKKKGGALEQSGGVTLGRSDRLMQRQMNPEQMDIYKKNIPLHRISSEKQSRVRANNVVNESNKSVNNLPATAAIAVVAADKPKKKKLKRPIWTFAATMGRPKRNTNATPVSSSGDEKFNSTVDAEELASLPPPPLRTTVVNVITNPNNDVLAGEAFTLTQSRSALLSCIQQESECMETELDALTILSGEENTNAVEAIVAVSEELSKDSASEENEEAEKDKEQVGRVLLKKSSAFSLGLEDTAAESGKEYEEIKRKVKSNKGDNVVDGGNNRINEFDAFRKKVNLSNNRKINNKRRKK